MMGMLTASLASAQTYYFVDKSTGSDSSNGTTEATAWRTIQKALDVAGANSIVQIKAGTYYENLTAKQTGTINNPIVYRSYQQDVVIIDGSATTGSTLLTIKDKSNLRFEHLTFQNITKNNAKGIYIESGANSINPASNLYFKRVTVTGINWNSSKTKEPKENNNAQPFIAYGRGTTVSKAITNLVIDSCEFYNNIPGYSEVLSIDGNINGFTIKNNLVHDNLNIGIYAGGNYEECSVKSLDHSRNGVIENNTCYNNVALYATSGGIYADGAQNVIIRNNRSYNNGYGIDLGCERDGTTDSITVINNLIYNNADAGITVGGYDTTTTGQVLGCIIRNNTLYQNDLGKNGSGEFYLTKASDCVFENNVVYTSSQKVLLSLENIVPQAGNKFNYNCWYNPTGDSARLTVNWVDKTYSSYTAYKKATYQDADSKFANPLLAAVPSLNLLAGSPCINAGNPATVLSSGETDFAGNTRVNGIIDIGAYESTGLVTAVKDILKGRPGVYVYPNPVKPSTTIYLTTPLNNGILEIYDISGKKTGEIRNITGTQIHIDGIPLKKGVYVYKLSQHYSVVATGKLVSVNE